MAKGSIDIKGLEAAMLSVPDGKTARRFASMSINSTVRWGRRLAQKTIESEIRFPSGYLSSRNSRLVVDKTAKPTDLDARISARARPTSLARFVVGNPKPNKAGVSVQVNPGQVKYMRRAFMMNLRSGAADSGKNNRGLAIRLRKGERIHRKRNVRRIAGGLYLLYGPSVQQAFLNVFGTGVAFDISPQVEQRMEEEFYRLLDLHEKGKI